jgi:hypothetical protein
MSGYHQKNLSFAGFIAQAIQTREIRNTVDSVITEMINQWEKGNAVKTVISNPVKWIVSKSFSKPEDIHQKNELFLLLKRLDITEHVGVMIPVIRNSLSEMLNTITVSLENASFDRQKKFIFNLISSVDPEIAGKFISTVAKAADAVHQHHPTFFSDTTIPGIGTFIQHTDFGDIRRFLDNSKEDITTMIQGLNDLLVAYPGKLITGLSFIPLITNHAVYYLKDLIYRLNLLPADILTDILISIFKDFDSKSVALLINHINELVRQIHTGSALIGESGSPQFGADFLEKIKTLQHEIDTELLLKAGKAIIDGKEVVQKTFNTLLDNDPKLLKVRLQQQILSYNSKIAMLKQKLELIDALNDDDDTETFASVISEMNGCDLAETINTFLLIVNALQENAPQTIQKIISEFISTLDLEEIENVLESFFIEKNELFEPLVRATFPALVNGLIESLSSKNDDNDENIERSKNKLRQFIMGEER